MRLWRRANMPEEGIEARVRTQTVATHTVYLSAAYSETLI